MTFTDFAAESKLTGPYDVATSTGNVELREILGGNYLAYLDAAGNRLRTFRACGATEYYDSGTCNQCASGEFSLEIEQAACQPCGADAFSTWACAGGAPYAGMSGSTGLSLAATTYTPAAAPVVVVPVTAEPLSLLEQLGSLSGEMDLWDGVFAAGTTFVMFNLAVHVFGAGSNLPPVVYAYLGNFLVATTAELAAAYALIHIVEATTPASSSSFATYGGKTTLGDYLGAAELVFFLAYLAWVAVLSVAGNYLAVVMWLNIDAYENTKTHVSKLTAVQGYKYLTVGILIALGGWIAALGVGDQSAQLFGIFDAFDTSADSSGSALFIDLALHGIAALANLGVLSTVAAGGYLMGIAILGTELNFSTGVEDLSNEESTYLADLKKLEKDITSK
jgi:hypothetical protein